MFLIGFTSSDVNSANNYAEGHGTTLIGKRASEVLYLCTVINELIV